jgi:hypothetical protein
VDVTDDCARFPWEVLEPLTEPADSLVTAAGLSEEMEAVEIDVVGESAYSRLETTR